MKRWVLFVLLGVVLGVIVAVVWALSLLGSASATTDVQPFVIAEGETVSEIADGLQSVGLIKSAWAFTWYTRLQGNAKAIQAGTYMLRPAMTVSEIVTVLAQGNAESRERTITILEGWNVEEIGTYLEGLGIFSKADWLAAANVTDSRAIVPDRTFDRLIDKPTTATLEGYMFPDTYRVFRDAKPADVVEKLLENFQAKISDDLVNKARAQGKTLYQILTMASILEREVLTDADKKRASGVFWKRIRDGMPLQSDATVNFVTKKGTTRPSFEDIAVDSPYNTYTNLGLPPGPIGSPGLGSIIAALEPEENDFYYFLTTEDGTAIFSRNLDEHNQNRQKYLGG